MLEKCEFLSLKKYIYQLKVRPMGKLIDKRLIDHKISNVSSVVLLGLILVGCGSTPKAEDPVQASPKAASVERAIALIQPTEGNTVNGMIGFTQTAEGVKLVVNLQGLPPNGVHAWHIHEFGDLSDPKGKATGGHYNPENHDHALPPTEKRHAGDLGNLKVDAQGNAHKEIMVKNISINGELNPILGRGVIVHAEEDDGGQPTGNAGGRIGQGVIGVRQVN